MSLDKNKWISGRLVIIVIAALMLALVVVPASGALKCNPYCTGWKKVALPGGALQENPKHYILFFNMRVGGVVGRYGLWVEEERTCSGSQFQKTCTDRTWCTNTRRCELTGTPVIQTKPASGTTCTPWVVTNYGVDPV